MFKTMPPNDSNGLEHYNIKGVQMLPVSRVHNFTLFRHMTNCFRVACHFEKCAMTDPNMTLYFGKMPLVIHCKVR